MILKAGSTRSAPPAGETRETCGAGTACLRPRAPVNGLHPRVCFTACQAKSQFGRNPSDEDRRQLGRMGQRLLGALMR